MFYPRPVQLLQCVRNPDHEDCRLCPSSMETSWNRVLHTIWFFYYYHLCVKLEKTWLHSLDGQVVLWCTEPITSSPCCDTNSQVAGGGTLCVILYTHEQTNVLFQEGQGLVQWLRAEALFWFLPSCAAPIVCRASGQGSLGSAQREFPAEKQLAVISVLPQKG